MNFLQSVQRLRQECGIPGSGPTTVVNQTGELKRLVDWYLQALEKVQMQCIEAGFDFLRTSMTFDTVANQQSYTTTEIGISAGFSSWKKQTFRIFLTSGTEADETFLEEFDYDTFRDLYLYGSQLTSYSRPTAITFAPDDSIILGLPPDDVYTVKGDYYKIPQLPTDDTDSIILPSQFHMLPVAEAMISYGAFEAAPEVYDRGKELSSFYMNKLMLNKLPQIRVVGSLV